MGLLISLVRRDCGAFAHLLPCRHSATLNVKTGGIVRTQNKCEVRLILGNWNEKVPELRFSRSAKHISVYSGRHNEKGLPARWPEALFVFRNFNVQALPAMSYQMAFSAN
jgi:hypothetical protein